MARKAGLSLWSHTLGRAVGAAARSTLRTGKAAVEQTLRSVRKSRQPPPGSGEWITGLALATAGMRRFKLFKPPGTTASERLPLLVMLHGCGQDATSFATSTRMNRVAARERFLVLYVEQDRSANPQGCWNWFSTKSGQAFAEAALVVAAIDQVCLLYPADQARVGIAGLSAGASMSALLATRYPGRFRAIVMHSGIAPGVADSTLTALGAMRGRREPLGPAVAANSSLPWPPLLVIHGALDRVVAANNARAATELWADTAGAKATASRRMQRGKRYASTWTHYRVRRKTVATLCEIDGLGHAWSGGDSAHPFGDAAGPDASRLIWSFVAKQFRTLD